MPEPTVRFLTLGMELKGDDASVLEAIHQTLDRLTQRRKGRLAISDGLEAVLRQVILYRVVATAQGTIVNWNTGNILCSFLAARALFETFAFLWDYERAISEARKTGTPGGFKALTMKRLGSTRDPAKLKKNLFHEATNISTFIDRLSEKYPDANRVYDLLSQRCHPNMEGTFDAFVDEIDERHEDIQLSDWSNLQQSFNLIVDVARLVGEAERLLNNLEAETPKIAEEIRKRDFQKILERSQRQEKRFGQFVADERQAFLGDARGQFAIGRAFAAGFPMKDPFRAHFWSSLAEAQGVKEAAKFRERIEPGLTSEQIQESQKLAKAWKPMTPEEFASHDEEIIERLRRLYPL